jgi:thioesterase domain-containing protein/acyl carrier protein
LGNTLTHVRSLLAPGGLLLLYEATQFPPYFDVAFPLLQQFDELDLRNGQPFLSVTKWRTVLLAHGFERVSVVPDVLDLDGNVFLARATMAVPAAAPPREAPATEPLPEPEPGLSLTLRPKLSNPYTPPTTDLEKSIVSVWEKCLGVQHVGLEDNFFELGGDSLLAVHLVAQLRKQFHAEISTHTLLQHLTVRGLVSYLFTRMVVGPTVKQSTHDPLVRIREGSGPRPLFLVHAGGGHTYMYYALARAFRLNVPVYGLQAQGVDGDLEPLSDLGEMAQQYVTAIRSVQPTGPYFLAGACVGGVIALEMAQRLRAQGEQVAMVALIDSYVSQAGASPEPDEAVMLALMINLGDDPSGLYEALRDRTHSERIAYILERKNIQRYLPELSAEHLQRLLNVFRAIVRALWSYTPRPYPERLTMLRAQSDEYLQYLTPTAVERTWDYLASGGMDIHSVPGNHFSLLLPPHVEVLAEKLAQSMVAAGQAEEPIIHRKRVSS